MAREIPANYSEGLRQLMQNYPGIGVTPELLLEEILDHDQIEAVRRQSPTHLGIIATEIDRKEGWIMAMDSKKKELLERLGVTTISEAIDLKLADPVKFSAWVDSLLRISR